MIHGRTNIKFCVSVGSAYLCTELQNQSSIFELWWCWRWSWWWWWWRGCSQSCP